MKPNRASTTCQAGAGFVKTRTLRLGVNDEQTPYPRPAVDRRRRYVGESANFAYVREQESLFAWLKNVWAYVEEQERKRRAAVRKQKKLSESGEETA